MPTMLRAAAVAAVLLFGAAAVVVRVGAVCESGTQLALQGQTNIWGVSGATLENRTEAPDGTNLFVVRE